MEKSDAKNTRLSPHLLQGRTGVSPADAGGAGSIGSARSKSSRITRAFKGGLSDEYVPGYKPGFSAIDESRRSPRASGLGLLLNSQRTPSQGTPSQRTHSRSLISDSPNASPATGPSSPASSSAALASPGGLPSSVGLMHSQVKPIRIIDDGSGGADIATPQPVPSSEMLKADDSLFIRGKSPERQGDRDLLSSIPKNFSSFSFSERKKFLSDLLPESLKNDSEYKSHLSKLIRKSSLSGTSGSGSSSGRRPSGAQSFINSFSFGGTVATATADNVNECGSVVMNKWKLGNIFNRGAFGLIRDCQNIQDESDNRAMKVIDVYDKIDFEERFKREVLMWSMMDHTNILPLQDFLLTSKCYFLLTPKVSGGSLFDIVKMWEAYKVPIEERLPRIEQFLTSLCKALAYMHSMGVFHGDIKLENCLIDSIQGDKLLVCDFGMAGIFDQVLRDSVATRELTQRVINQKELLQGEHPSRPQSRRGSVRMASMNTQDCHNLPDELIGSLPYAAPELVDDNCTCTGKLDNLTDMWAFGVLMYVLVSLQLPFCRRDEEHTKRAILECRYDTDTFGEALNSHAPVLLEVLDGCLRKDRSSRLTATHTLDLLMTL